MKRKPLIDGMYAGSLRVSLPRFIMLGTSIVLFVGLGALVAGKATGDGHCVEAFFRGSGALFLVALAIFQFSLSRMAARQFSEGEPLQPAWFLIMLAGCCRLVSALCVQILSVRSPLNPLAYGTSSWSGLNPADIQRFGLLVGGPLEMLLMAGGMAYVLRVCRRARIVVRPSASDAIFLLIAIAGAWLEMQRMTGGSAYEILLATRGPLLVLLLVQAAIIRRYMAALSGGMIAKCWNSFAAAIFLAAVANLGQWLPFAEPTWYIWLLSSTALALGPAWQIEAVQSACGEVGVSRFSPFAMSLAALRLLNTSR